MSDLPKLIYRFKTIPIKISGGYFLTEIDRLILKFIQKYNRPSILKGNLVGKVILKENIAGGFYSISY